jgi:transcriptional regulator with XRE-family HTH domain
LCSVVPHGEGMSTRPRIGTVIRRARERKRMRQQDLADAIGVSRTTVDAWENNRSYPRSSIGALETVLEIALDGDQPAAAPGLVAADEWEASVLADPDLPAEVKVSLVRESRAARAEYVRLKRERRAEAEAGRLGSARSGRGTAAG